MYLFVSKKLFLASHTTLQVENNVLIYLVNLLVKHLTAHVLYLLNVNTTSTGYVFPSYPRKYGADYLPRVLDPNILNHISLYRLSIVNRYSRGHFRRVKLDQPGLSCFHAGASWLQLALLIRLQFL